MGLLEAVEAAAHHLAAVEGQVPLLAAGVVEVPLLVVVEAQARHRAKAEVRVLLLGVEEEQVHRQAGAGERPCRPEEEEG